jgi:class 3 adenylate cyclase/alpha-beta hydrolase superfamily lysophospholipase
LLLASCAEFSHTVSVATRYARSGDTNIAYQIHGDGPVDLVYVPGFASHVELSQEEPRIARHHRRLASFARVVFFDKRGTGMSDPWQGAPTLDERMDDIRAVMDAANLDRSAILGVSEGGPMAIVFAATYPERVTALVLYASGARFTRTEDYPYGATREEASAMIDFIEATWGESRVEPLSILTPALADDEAFREAWSRIRRRSASPRMAADLLRMACDIDIRAVLPSVRTPTLVLHRRGDRFIPVEHGRYLAEHLPAASYVELDGDDHLLFVGDLDVDDHIEEFLTGGRRTSDPDRALATVLFTDIVDSTRQAGAIGDRRWRELLDLHDSATAREVNRFGGRVVKSMGDGSLATFDRPGRAITTTRAIAAEVTRIGLQVRAGIHTGEVETRDADIGGLAVHIAARIAALAGPGETLVSRTVKDLLVGSEVRFNDHGCTELKGVPGEWQLFAVSRQNSKQRP